MSGFGIYIHWPFCKSKCPYCDFNSHVGEAIDMAAWQDAYLRALDQYVTATGQRTVTSVFFGGGTPSLMTPSLVARVIGHIKSHWPLSDDVEITAEANPSSAETEVFRGFREAGINRLSLGVQSLVDEDLIFLGRRHNAAEARTAVQKAAEVFERFSVDLIYARPGQTPAAWADELARALAFGTSHMSLYQLTIEPGTDFHRQRVPAAAETIGEQLFDLTQEMMAGAGMPAYEISNHARPGEDCRHNLVYWRGEDYIGVGPGAHGRLTGEDGRTDMTLDVRLPGDWLSRVRETGSGLQKRTALSFDERRDEIILMGLRLTEGVSAARFKAQTGRSLFDSLPPDNLDKLVSGGFLSAEAGGLKATPDGRLRLDAVLAALLA